MTDNTLHQLTLIRAAMVVSAATSRSITADTVSRWAELIGEALEADRAEVAR